MKGGRFDRETLHSTSGNGQKEKKRTHKQELKPSFRSQILAPKVHIKILAGIGKNPTNT